jgi:hypothetical protein
MEIVINGSNVEISCMQFYRFTLQLSPVIHVIIIQIVALQYEALLTAVLPQ